jgi:hypothetical protein
MGKAQTKPAATTSVLKPEVAAVYTVAEGVLQRFVDTEWGDVDLATIDLALAEKLADKGYLIRNNGE